jgi:hypothetical protein
MDSVVTLTGAQRGFLMMIEEGNKLRFKIGRNVDQQSLSNAEFQASRTVIKQVIQNGEPVLGWTFLVAEAALVIGTAITVPMYAYAQGRSEEEQRRFDVNRTAELYQERADNIRTVNLSLAGAVAAIGIIGIVQANLAYVPEKVETKRRDLPVVSRIKPVVSPLFVGITGTMF